MGIPRTGRRRSLESPRSRRYHPPRVSRPRGPAGWGECAIATIPVVTMAHSLGIGAVARVGEWASGWRAGEISPNSRRLVIIVTGL
jgi:hypothetical protein